MQWKVDAWGQSAVFVLILAAIARKMPQLHKKKEFRAIFGQLQLMIKYSCRLSCVSLSLGV
jgi:hypothetical protein